MRRLTLILLTLAIATSADAVVKVYDATPPNGIAGDEFQFTTALCPPIQSSPGIIIGDYALSDTGTGTVTIVNWNQVRKLDIDFDTTAQFGPGSFVFIDSKASFTTTVGQTAPGSTAPGGTIDWGVLTGWNRTGAGYCISSPVSLCNATAQLPHGQTSPAPQVNSPTYDIGTWSFDAQGDFQANGPYIFGTFLGGTSNRQILFRGAFVGGGVPALPLMGVGALAIALVVAGTRSTLRKK